MPDTERPNPRKVTPKSEGSVSSGSGVAVTVNARSDDERPERSVIDQRSVVVPIAISTTRLRRESNPPLQILKARVSAQRIILGVDLDRCHKVGVLKVCFLHPG